MKYNTSSNLHTRLLAATLGLCACATFAPGRASAQTGVETFVMATSGEQTGSIFTTPKPIADNFGGTSTSVPGDAVADSGRLAGFGVSGLFRTQSASGNAALTDSTAISGNGNSQFGLWTFSGNAAAAVVPGQLKATAAATHTGGADNQSINNAAAYSLFRETLLATSGTVLPGTTVTMRLEMTIDGSMTVSGIGRAAMKFDYGYGATAPGTPSLDNSLLESTIDVYPSNYSTGTSSYLGGGILPPGIGYTVGPANAQGGPSFVTLSGTSKVYATIPMTLGVNTSFRMGLLTYIYPNNGDGVMEGLFGDTATLTGIQLLDGSNRPITDFTLTSGSGAIYDANGVQLAAASAAPEPASFALLVVAGLIPVGRVIRRGRSPHA